MIQQQRIKVSTAHAKKLMDAVQRANAINQSIQVQQELVQRALRTAQQSIQEKIEENQRELQTTWEEISKAHGIDIRNVLWDFDQSTGEIFVKAIQFNTTGS